MVKKNISLRNVSLRHVCYFLQHENMSGSITELQEILLYKKKLHNLEELASIKQTTLNPSLFVRSRPFALKHV